MRLLPIAVFAAVVSTCAVAQASADTVKQKTTCRSVMLTGSRMATRSCHTAKEWSDIEDGHSRDLTKASISLGVTSKTQTDEVGKSPF